MVDIIGHKSAKAPLRFRYYEASISTNYIHGYKDIKINKPHEKISI
jgi:hypothetical protein